jgi:protein-S-isoprenylcysteine O-methyltransferase
MLISVGVLGAIFSLSEVALSVFKRSRAKDSAADSGSLRKLWIVIVCSTVVASMLAPAASAPQAMLVTGFMIFALGALLRWYSIGYLGRFFTVDVNVRADHQIVDTGPYRFIRHPSYTGVLVEFLGFGLCLGSGLSMLVMMAPIIAVFLYRIRVEEAALERGLGERYTAYRARTKKLVPFVY